MRKRRRTPFPEHIDRHRLPKGIYWESAGYGYWYASKRLDGKQIKKKVAGGSATLAELYSIMDLDPVRATTGLRQRGDEFLRSNWVKETSIAQQKQYCYGLKLVCEHKRIKSEGIPERPLKHWDAPLVQRTVNYLAESHGPCAVEAGYASIRRLFNWAVGLGYASFNPCGVHIRLPKKRNLRRIPKLEVYDRVLAFAKERGALTPRTRGSHPPFIWMVMELAYLCRLRGCEVFALTDDCVTDQGIQCIRTKGSKTNIVRCNSRLAEVLLAASEERRIIWNRLNLPHPMRPDKRPILISSTTGGVIQKTAWQSVWRRFMHAAIAEGVTSEEEYFTLHSLKRRGITDTPGTKSERMEASGHRSPQMFDIYDFSVPIVDPASD